LERLDFVPVSSKPQGSLKMTHDEQVGRFPSHLTFFRRQVLHAWTRSDSMQATAIPRLGSTNLGRADFLNTRSLLLFHSWKSRVNPASISASQMPTQERDRAEAGFLVHVRFCTN
jgi:hypothetical protein